ncbi:MAG: Trm112 family protein [Gemmatimonadales bacterium]
MIDRELLEILCCPKTKVPVEMLSEDKLKAVNDRIGRGEVKTADGSKVDKPLDAGLITEDGKTIYRIDDDIPIMLIDEGIPADQIT